MLTPPSGTLADYNAAILNGNTTSVRLVFSAQSITLNGDDIAANGGIVLNSILNSETDLQMGKAVMTECVSHLLNSNTFSGFDWTEEFRLDFGVKISGTTKWVTVGYFTGTKPEKSVLVDVIQFTAYDRMQKFDIPADDFIAGLTFPLTMAQIYSALCTYVGVTSAVGNEMADSMALSFSENPFNSGMTCRSILAAIAEANGCYAKITADGKVKLVWYTDQTSNYSVDGDDYFRIDMDEDDTSGIDYIRVGCTYDSDFSGFVYPVGTSGEGYQIIDNPFLLKIGTADLTTVLTNILARFTAFGTYRPMSMTITGNWMVELGDIIEVDVGGTTYDMPIFARTFSWNGGAMDGYECTGKASRTEVTESAKEQMETGGKLANKYTIRSGVDITDEGVTISGGRYLKLISGGVLDVQSTNFVIDSANRLFSAGYWTFSDNGIKRQYETTVDGNDYDVAFKIEEGLISYIAPPTGSDFRAGIHYKTDRVYKDAYDKIRYDVDMEIFAQNPITQAQKSLRLRFREWNNTNNDDVYDIIVYPGTEGGRFIVYDVYSAEVKDLTVEEIHGDCLQEYDSVTVDGITWDTSNVTKANCSYTIHKWGKLCILEMAIYVKNNISGFTSLGTLASAYRPATLITGTMEIFNSSSVDVRPIQIQSNGTIRTPNASASSGSTTTYNARFVYFTA